MTINAIESEFRTSNMANRSEMARNAMESGYRTSKMATEKKQWPTAAILSKISKKIKIPY